MKMKIKLLLLLLMSSVFFADDAYDYYRRGEEAATVADRAQFFNNALLEYKKMETEAFSGKLLYNIANTYFQLGEYGQAILYYQRALVERPRDKKIKTNLTVSIEKAGIVENTQSKVWDILFFFHYRLSITERQMAFLIFGVSALVMWSAYIWSRKQYWRVSGVILTLCWGVFFCSLFWTLYCSSVEGVVVNPSMVRRDAGKHYKNIVDKPITAGTKIRIKGEKGSWFKVEVDDKYVGFIDKDDAEVI
jgi:tetratricopeptide (TPR) repeat protein